jgi:hypothetical protein
MITQDTLWSPTVWSAQDTLALSRDWVQEPLIDAPTLARIVRFARGLTGPFSSYYLECRLTPDSRVDLLASLLRTEERSWVARGAQGPSPAWARVDRFARAWTDPDSSLHARVPLIWLEFDQVHGLTPPAGPCFHLCADGGYPAPGDPRPARAPEPAAQARLIHTGLELLLGHPPAAGVARGLEACIEAVGPAGRLIHVSAMLTRTPLTLKVYGCLPAHDFPRYLRDIGWPGSIQDTRRWLERFITPDTSDERIFFDLAFEERLTGSVGVVFSQPQLGHGENTDPTRRSLLERLVAERLCTPAKRDALLHWPGRTRVSHPETRQQARLHRWLDIKLSHHPDRSLEAKAYLGLRPASSPF